jgi:hypothetical protein
MATAVVRLIATTELDSQAARSWVAGTAEHGTG